MNLEDIKDQIKEQASSIWGTIQENPTFNSLRERYETLPANAQQGIWMGTGVCVILILLSFPYSYLSTASDNMVEFEETRGVIRELLRASRLNQGAPPPPQGLSASELSDRVQGALGTFLLLPEQIGEVKEMMGAGADSLARPPITQQGVAVSLREINLTQILDIGFRLQQLANSVKLSGVEITSSPVRSGYFDVVFKLVSFSLPAEPEPPATPPARRGSTRSRSANTDSGEGD